MDSEQGRELKEAMEAEGIHGSDAVSTIPSEEENPSEQALILQDWLNANNSLQQDKISRDMLSTGLGDLDENGLLPESETEADVNADGVPADLDGDGEVSPEEEVIDESVVIPDIEGLSLEQLQELAARVATAIEGQS